MEVFKGKKIFKVRAARKKVGRPHRLPGLKDPKEFWRC
jgi:hypothetical protein